MVTPLAHQFASSVSINKLNDLIILGILLSYKSKNAIQGYFLAAENPSIIDVVLLAFGGYFMVGASNAFNQILEKDLDALMDRTKNMKRLFLGQ